MIDLNFCVFASGSGSNFIELHKFSKKQSNIDLKLLISNNPNCGAVEYASLNEIKFKILDSNKFLNYSEYVEELLKCLIQNNIDFIALAGYLKKIPNQVITKFNRRILNIHPSLLPKFGGKGFYGMNVHKAVIDSKDKTSGVTIHFVDKNYDEGPIIFQEEVKVFEMDTPQKLSVRILNIEHRVYKKVIKILVENNFNIINKKIKIERDEID